MKRILGLVRGEFIGLLTLVCATVSCALAAAQMPELKTLDPAFFAKSAPPEVVATAILFKTHPELLDDPTYMRTFVMMNNCTPNQGANQSNTFRLETALKNEFERPKITAFYKGHAASILDSLTIKPLEITTYGPPLGEYDATEGAFPFNVKRNNGLPMDNIAVRGSGWFTMGCGNAWLPARFQFSPIFLKNVPASQAAAEDYVTNVVKNQPARSFQILLKMELGRADFDTATGSIVVDSKLDSITLRGVGQVTRPAFGGVPTAPTIVVLSTLDPKAVAYAR